MKKKKIKRKIIIYLCLAAIIVASVFVTYAVQKINNKSSYQMTVEEAQKIIEDTLADLPNSVSGGAKYIVSNTKISAESIEYGTDKNTIVKCSYSSPDAGGVVEKNLNKYLSDVYSYYIENQEQGIKTNATKIKLRITEQIEKDLDSTDYVNGKITFEIFEVSEGEFSLYLEDETINTVLGGILDAQEMIKNAVSLEYNGQTVQIEKLNTLRNGIRDCISLKNYDSRKPDTSVPIEKWWNNLKYDFDRNFIQENRYTYITRGVATTLLLTVFSVIIGIIIGFIVAVIRCVNQKTGKLDIPSDICKLYLSVMRGTPIMVQLLIVYFVILLPLGVPRMISAIVCFGLNSGAYVSEIIRGGIMSIDEGQEEAGRSLGFTYMQTMLYIIIPQAFKAVLPALANEFIALLKESSIAFYIGVADLTLGGIKIRSITYSNFMPLITIALVYWIMVLILSKGVSMLERRLRAGDKR